MDKISFASAGLLSITNTFFEDCQLEREATDKLFDWIKKSLPENKPSIAVLTGKAGCGKSVILKDLLKKLKKKNIPVLGIKTDLLVIDSITQLSRELDLADGIKETLVSIVEKYGKAVILFDQIDALSQTMSTDRKVINSYINLISQLCLVLNLRIIISCRTFDLKYDPLLRSFEEKHIIDVVDLSEEDVEFVLSRMGLEKPRVSKTLMDLLKVPLHLKVFCDIYEKETNLASLNTLQDLYDGLWDQHILTAIDRSSVLDTIVIATEKMDESKSLAIPFALLDRNNASRQHLLSQSILIQQKKTLQFFHQSFFDYCYSRTFLNRHDSLIGVVLQQHQGLFVRPQIKQVLAYLRGSDFPKYLKELKEFLGNKNVRFHIWLLVVNQLAFVEDPTDEEWQIIKPLLDTETDFRKHFIDALQSEQWLKYLITNRYIHTFLKSLDNKLVNIVVWKLRSLINSFTDTIVDFIYDFPGIERKNESIWNILAGLDHWKSNKAVELLEGKLKALKRSPDHDYYYYHFLKSLFPYKPEIVCRIFFDDLDEKLDEIRSPDEFDKRGFCDYHDMDMFQKIGSWNEEVALSEGLKVICDLVEKTGFESKVDFYNDRAFLGYEQFERDLYERWKILGFVQENLKIVGKNDKPKFLRLVTGFQESNSLTLLKLLIQGYLSNPKIYVNEAFRLLTRN
ncbi:MAG: ATP-binding protein, partial [Gammaproteobacteria bacterium]|nr:ATP-binding protein [Gammaproteobacteria bacterium]